MKLALCASLLAGATFAAPAGVNTMLVTGLSPSTAYGVSIQTSGSGKSIAVSASGATATTDSAGLLRLSF